MATKLLRGRPQIGEAVSGNGGCNPSAPKLLRFYFRNKATGATNFWYEGTNGLISAATFGSEWEPIDYFRGVL